MAVEKRQRSKDEEMKYCLRLNLTNPEHVEIQKKLRELDMGVHKSINQFIIKALLFYIQYGDQEKAGQLYQEKQMNDILKRYLPDIVLQVKAEVLKELVTLLKTEAVEEKNGSMNQIPVNENRKEESSEQKREELEADETLEELASLWS